MTNKNSFRASFPFALSRAQIAIVGFILGTAVACVPESNDTTGSGGSQGTGGSTATGGSTGSGSGGSTSSGGSTGSGGSSTGTGGSVGSGGSTGSGGSGSGGTGSGGSGSGGSGSGGSMTGSGGSGSGGAAGGGGRGSGGAGGRGVTGGSTGSGGAATGSGGAGTGTGGAGGSTTTGMVMPSAGCGKSGRPSGGKVSMSNVQIIDFPTSYDGTKPFPLLVALHACGNPNTQWEGITNNNGFGTEYVRYMPNTTDTGQCWSNYNNNIARILQQYDDIMANYCIDMNHVYGVGHSSGAQMLVNILSHKTDAQHLNLRAVSPVAADPYNVAIPMPVLYIDGIMDNQRSATSATNAVARFRTANMCSDTSMPYTEIMGCKSSEGPQVDPGCKIYDNCTVPTIWCAHNDPSYSGTQHGIPCFALTSMYNFFKSLW